MSVKKLTEPAQKILEAYLNLSTKGHKIPCPYYNNKHNNVYILVKEAQQR